MNPAAHQARRPPQVNEDTMAIYHQMRRRAQRPSDEEESATPASPRRVRFHHGMSMSRAVLAAIPPNVQHLQHRTGSPALTRLPALRWSLPLNSPSYQIILQPTFRDEVDRCLSAFGIEVKTVSVELRKCEQDPEAWNPNHETIFIIAEETDGTNVPWLPACQAIKLVCVRYRVPHMKVEIAHEDGLHRWSKYAVEDTHRLEQQWESYEQWIIRYLGERDYVDIELVRLRRRPGPNPNPLEHPVTVLLTIYDDPDDTENWSLVMDNILRLLDRNGFTNVGCVIQRTHVYPELSDQIERDVTLDQCSPVYPEPDSRVRGRRWWPPGLEPVQPNLPFLSTPR